jgi:cell division protein FtsA
MPKNKTAAVMDIGSSKITVLCGEHGINRVLNIKGKGEAFYAGFSDGEFLEPEKLLKTVERAILQAEENIKSRIRKLYIGVPAEFCTVICKEVSIAFKSRRKITEIDIEELYLGGKTQDAKYSLINEKPIYYTLDDNRKVLNPVGLVSSKISGLLSFNYAENKFINTFKNIAENLNIYETEFVSSSLAEGGILFDEKDKLFLFADIGYLTSSVALYQGEGLLFLKSFSTGAAHISADLMECLNIPFVLAEKLKDEIRLNFEIEQDDKYKVTVNDESCEVSAVTANEIARARIEYIGEMIKKCLKQCSFEVPPHLPLYITGGGLSFIRGAAEILAVSLDRNAEIIWPQLAQFGKPYLSSPAGLLDFCLGVEEKEKKGFLSRLFG